MVEFGLYLNNRPQIYITASTEERAWEKLKQGGILNRGKTLELKTID